ncbi:hypothetical protein R1sor_006526 [Riccia sorocarpa]|uniref:Uncharacterized protein n=1 Tax=Riccia sorocarpa TaxID=122646 RepID=A0ABD3HRH4_9MARC
MGSQCRRQRTIDRNRTDHIGASRKESSIQFTSCNFQKPTGIRRKVIEMMDTLNSLSCKSIEYESQILTRFLNHSSIRKAL